MSVAQPANAAFIAHICDAADCSGAVNMAVTDNLAGDNFGATPGVINFGAIGVNGIDIAINTSQSKPALASGMDVAYVATVNPGGAGGTVWLIATDTDFLGTGSLSGSIGGTSDNGSVEANLCGGDSNVQFNDSPCVGSGNLTPGGGGVIGATFGALNPSVSPHSLLLSVRITLTGPGTATGDFRAIPEPVTLAMFGLGLVTVGTIVRRRRTAKV